ncbi:MAG: TetR/AcrR family transcriptional regulator [Paenibacillus sp.]|uniref:TetR/AcrR family transcriptional regulator n=1 Tax=Paenibacillus sp. TaxID=58172 RepID=UPI002914F514|nr:TetR/AcrR family transcriptional regulator [Paenibacillus sp.]MDU4695418.1 TetR/AcrR family transcriptional regulator [Paenibacillus sp.]
MALKKREQQSLQTKEKILRNSIELITTYGYDEVTVSQICQKSEVAKGSFYTHFSSKSDIAIEILKDINVRLFHGLEIDEKQPAEPQLREYTRLYFRTVMECGPAMSREIFKIIHTVKFSSGDVSDLHNSFIECYIRLGQTQGAFRQDLNPEKIGHYWSDGNLGLVRYWIADSEGYDLMQEGMNYFEFMMNAIRVR